MENINDFKLPLHIDDENHYLDCVKAKTNYYIKKFTELLSNERLQKYHGKLHTSIEYIKDLIDKITNIIDDLLKGRDKHAYETMSYILGENIGSIFTPINKANAFLGNPLYRELDDTISEKYLNLFLFRGRISKPYETYRANEMLHVPLNKRGIVGSYRFSIPGVPCLYLASNSYIVWKEMGCPPLNELTISAVKIEPELLYNNILDLTLPIDIYFDIFDDETNKIENNPKLADIIIRCMKVIPLIIACSTVCDKETARYFKIEYLFPQLLMRYLADNNAGIAYKSNRIENCSLWTTNLALPIVEYDNNKKYGRIIDRITISDSLNMGNFNDLILPNKIDLSYSLTNVNKSCPHNPFQNPSLCKRGANSTFNKMIDGLKDPYYENKVPYKKSVFYFFDEYILYCNELKEVKNENI